MLEGGKERVHLRKRGALRGSHLLHGNDAPATGVNSYWLAAGAQAGKRLARVEHECDGLIGGQRTFAA